MTTEPIKKVLSLGSPDSLAFFMAVGGLLYGLFLLLPFETFQSSKSFLIMNEIMPEWTWGIILFTLSSIKLFTLYKHLKYGNTVLLQFILNLITGSFWILVAISLISANPTSAATVIYPMFAIAHFWIAAQRQAALRKLR